MRVFPLLLFVIFSTKVKCLNRNEINFSVDYFMYKRVHYICYLSCENNYLNHINVKKFILKDLKVSVKQINSHSLDVAKLMKQWNVPVGVMLDGNCDRIDDVLLQASRAKLFDAMHYWLVLFRENDTLAFIEDHFQHLNLSVDADVAVVNNNAQKFTLTDVFNFGKIQGNDLEIRNLGSWSPDNGLKIYFEGYKYYSRWDFHNLTLRAVSVKIFLNCLKGNPPVSFRLEKELISDFERILKNDALAIYMILDKPKEFSPEVLVDASYTAGIAAMTKITSQLLNIIKEIHNFRFNYTIAGKWIGTPERNSTLAVTNSLYWGEQDISSTCARIFPAWLEWVDVFLPPTTNMETKFYYLIPDKGIGDYENRFLTPMSPGVWWCTLAACAVCSIVLAAGAWLETRPKAAIYAFFSVSAAICQQDFEDGVPDENFSSQGRKATLLVVGLTSMLLYNYYTSSVVSWLLNAATPSIDSLDQLINSDLEPIFEDIGYTRGWIDNPGFFYYSGFKNLKEDKLREKVLAKRSSNTLQPVASGIEMIRSGRYAYHAEPYTANQVISKTFLEDELCELGSLQMIKPAHVYVMSQKRSPFKEFFVWSLMRLSERGHFTASQGRFPRTMPACSGRRPRALALGQAAPAFVMLMQFTLLSVFMLIMERMHFRLKQRAKTRIPIKNGIGSYPLP